MQIEADDNFPFFSPSLTQKITCFIYSSALCSLKMTDPGGVFVSEPSCRMSCPVTMAPLSQAALPGPRTHAGVRSSELRSSCVLSAMQVGPPGDAVPQEGRWATDGVCVTWRVWPQ